MNRASTASNVVVAAGTCVYLYIHSSSSSRPAQACPGDEVKPVWLNGPAGVSVFLILGWPESFCRWGRYGPTERPPDFVAFRVFASTPGDEVLSGPLAAGGE